MDIEKLKYPIGKFEKPINITNEKRYEFIEEIKNFLEFLKK